MSEQFSYDVFLSHSSKDKPVVRAIAERLKQDGLRVWFDEWEIKPGDSIPAKIEEGLEHSRVLVLCMSANAFGSDWAQMESGTFRFRDPLNKERRFIPLRLDDAPIKGSLAQFLFLKWRPADSEQEYPKLLESCRPPAKQVATDLPDEGLAKLGTQVTREQVAKNAIGPVCSQKPTTHSPMAIKDSTMKRLFGMSRNQCAMPDCKSPLVIGDVVVGEICHIRARSKGGPRYNATLTAAQKNEFENLILLCSTCHKLVDASPDEYTADWLQNVKRAHESGAPVPLELSRADACQAMMILAKHNAQTTKPKKSTGDTTVQGNTKASATHGGVAVAIAGPNQGNISIRMPAPKSSGSKYPANSIGADANMTNYIEYLCDLYVKFMRSIEPDEGKSWAKLGKHIKTKFHLKKRTRNHLSAERFWDLVDFLVNEKLALTPVGRKHRREATKLCRTFEEFRHGEM
jgi:hypothetical protein